MEMKMTYEPHDHDRGLEHDLKLMCTRALGRRNAFGIFASAAVAAVVAGCGDSGTSSTTSSTGTGSTGTGSTGTGSTGSGSTGASSACVAAPAETNGPYPSDGSNTANGTISNILTQTGVMRADIRSSFGATTTQAQGVTLTLRIKIVNVNNSCAALAGYAIYIWHCDKDGRYSIYDLPNENYLRGVGVTDTNGEVTFTTIYPGAYAGRYPHIHFEVFNQLSRATTYLNRTITSQFAMPAAANSEVYNNDSRYAASVRNYAGSTTSNDNVFGDNSAAQVTAMTPVLTGSPSAGYSGTVTVGVSV